MSARSLSVAECRLLLRSKRVGRVVFTDRALPSALPVNYTVVDGGVVFRTDPGGLLSHLVEGAGDAVLGFQVDEVDESFESGWSVLVVGLALRVPERETHELESLGLRAWGSESASTFIRIPFDRMGGQGIGDSSVTTAVARSGRREPTGGVERSA